MTLNHNCGCFSGVGGIAGNVLQLYAVVCRHCAVGKLRIGAVIRLFVLIFLCGGKTFKLIKND